MGRVVPAGFVVSVASSLGRVFGRSTQVRSFLTNSNPSVVPPETPFCCWWEAEVLSLLLVDVAPVLFGNVVHVDVQLSPSAELDVGNVVALVAFHMIRLPLDRAVSDEQSTGVYRIILGLRG
jgi:hypothetical protein